MKLKPWKKIREELVVENPWWQYWKGEYVLPSGDSATFHEVRKRDFVAVIPVREDGKILMVKLYRPNLSDFSIEFPAGGVEEGETYEQAAHRELQEEGGVVAGTLAFICHGVSDAGTSSQRYKAYVATELRQQPVESDETEAFEHFWWTAEEIDEKILGGDIVDAHSIAPWFVARNHVLTLVDGTKKTR